jgi:hypothetical protein
MTARNPAPQSNCIIGDTGHLLAVFVDISGQTAQGLHEQNKPD